MLTHPSGVSCPCGSSCWQISSISAVTAGKNTHAGAKGRSSSTTLVIAYLPMLTVAMRRNPPRFCRAERGSREVVVHGLLSHEALDAMLTVFAAEAAPPVAG